MQHVESGRYWRTFRRSVMPPVGSSETVPKDGYLHTRHRENLKSHWGIPKFEQHAISTKAEQEQLTTYLAEPDNTGNWL
jgi:hypothetical protein